MSETIYFKTSKQSETGKRLSAIYDRMQECLKAQKELAKKYGFKQWRGGVWVASGGISAVMFDQEYDVDHLLWKYASNGNEDEYYPSKRTKEGKKIVADFESLPVVKKNELNEAVGYKGNIFRKIGFGHNHPEFNIFCVGADWGYQPKDDCIEITYSEYQKLASDEE